MPKNPLTYSIYTFIGAVTLQATKKASILLTPLALILAVVLDKPALNWIALFSLATFMASSELINRYTRLARVLINPANDNKDHLF